MDGVITGVTDFGLFVNLERYFISGLLHVSDLPDDRYQYLQDRIVLLKDEGEVEFINLDRKLRLKLLLSFRLNERLI
jgi:ribonuclease R